MGLSGIWLGPTNANIFLALCYNIFIMNIDWRQLILDAKARVKKESEVKDELERETEDGYRVN